MGTFAVKVTISNPSNPPLSTTVDCLVDTGAAYSQMPRSLLESLGIIPFDHRPVIFADGKRGTCQVGRAEFVVNRRQTPALVIFGEETAPSLLGAMTLEGVGLGIDPLGRRLAPLEVPPAYPTSGTPVEPPGVPPAAGTAGPAGFGRRGTQSPRGMQDGLSPARHARSVGGAAGARLARHRRGPAGAGAVQEASLAGRPPHPHAQCLHVSW
jgi:clan AA aspartic protease